MPGHHSHPPQKGPSQRQLRVGEMLRHALSEILRETDIRDPDLMGVSVTVTQVKPSPDMRYATVFVEPLGGKNASTIVAALNRHKEPIVVARAALDAAGRGIPLVLLFAGAGPLRENARDVVRRIRRGVVAVAPMED